MNYLNSLNIDLEDKTRKEPFVVGKVLFPNSQNRVHIHNGLEMGIILNGNGSLKLGNDTIKVKKDDFFFFESAIEHNFSSQTNSALELIWIVIPTSALIFWNFGQSDSRLFEPFFSVRAGLSPIINSDEYFVKNIFKIYELFEQKLEHWDLISSAKLFEIVIKLNKKTSSQNVSLDIFPNFTKILNSVFYININFSNKITTEFLANRAKLDEKEFCKSFEEIIGLSPNDYKQEQQLRHSLQQLLYSNLTIDDIAKNSCYENPVNYSESFIKFFNSTPEEFRKLNKSN